MIVSVVKVLAPSTIAFLMGIALTPLLTHYLYKYKLWKKKAKDISTDGRATPVFNMLHGQKEIGTPRMGGIIIWASAFLTILAVWIISQIYPSNITEKLDFLSRSQTWLPLFTLTIGAAIGLIDDFFEVSGTSDYLAGGLSLRKRLLVVFLLGAVGAWWFYFKLDVSSIWVPFLGDFNLGLLFIPFFIGVMMWVYSGGVIDGIDGLAGGVFTTIFAAYAGVAFSQNQIDLAAFCAVIAGGTLAFLWFNIPPARYYMSETGTMALTTTLAVVAFLTNSVMVLPLIAFPLFATTVSDIIQLGSKKIRGKKVFLIAPLHHHFEALGYPSHNITMRYWVLGVIFAIIGMIIVLIG